MTEKDAMFFRAHMEAAHLRESLHARAGSRGPTPSSDPLFQELSAQAELDYIENSRAWRFIRRLKGNPLYRRLARMRFGPNWEHGPQGDPSERLARVKASRAYKCIQAVKRLPPYLWYARRRYGADFTIEGSK
jgi:hypothetical protein